MMTIRGEDSKNYSGELLTDGIGEDMKKLNKLGQEGFTLIEILMAVLIIVILAVVGITQFNNFAADAKNAATKSNLAILRNAIGTMNALERVRCAKTTIVFPDPVTVQTNDITACTAANTNAACYFSNLMNPMTGGTYTACTLGTAAPDTYYNAKIPAVDRPFVQGSIPDNPWTSPAEMRDGSVPNFVSADIANVALPSYCENAPVYIGGGTTATANATQCATAAPGTVFDAADGAGAAPSSYTTSVAFQGEGGWCYCALTGQIWANTANNDGKGTGTGIESQF